MKEHTKLIMNYLEGDMTARERTAFEERLKNDPDLFNELQMHQRIDKFGNSQKIEDSKTISSGDIKSIETEIHELGIDSAVKSLMNDWNKEDGDKSQQDEIRAFVENTLSKKSKPKIRKIALWASVAAASVIIVMLFVLNGQRYTNDELYAQLKRPIDISSSNTKGSSTVESVTQKAYDAYRSGNYSEAETHADRLISEGTDLPEIYFIKASVLMLQHQKFTEAVEMLDKAEKLSDSYKLEAEYFKMLCYLKIGDNEKVTEICNRLNGKLIYDSQCELILKHISLD